MKKITVIIVLIFTISCVKEMDKYSIQYIIKNETSTPLKLNFYLSSNNQLIDVFTINVNETIKGNLTERGTTPQIKYPKNSLAITELSSGDSLVTIFNNEKKIIMYTSPTSPNGFSEPLNRNLFRHGNYEYLGNDQFQFTFTEEDYENAEDCGGPCE